MRLHRIVLGIALLALTPSALLAQHYVVPARPLPNTVIPVYGPPVVAAYGYYPATYYSSYGYSYPAAAIVPTVAYPYPAYAVYTTYVYTYPTYYGYPSPVMVPSYYAPVYSNYFYPYGYGYYYNRGW